MKYLRHFIVEGKHLGATPCSAEFVHELLLPPEPVAYFCPHCAEIWARAMVTTTDNVFCEAITMPWRVYTVPCRKHPGSMFQVPGSLDLPWVKGWLESFPDSAVAWEFQRQMEQYFKE